MFALVVSAPVLLQPISLSMVSGVQCNVENCLMQLYDRPYHKVSAEIAVAMVMLTENPANCEVLYIFCRSMRY